MCGILGVLSLEGRPIDLRVLQEMNDLQAHRGPDGEGFLLASDRGGDSRARFVRTTAEWDEHNPVHLALGHRRLAIIDLSDRGLQPMTVDDGSTWIVFNGEIYNHVELRDELRSLGFEFTTHTDTEVLLKAYMQWGTACLSHLEGMFSFAVWDGRNKGLFCARDRFGIKPFYYAVTGGYFVFASEIKALLSFPGLQAIADDEAVLGFLSHGNCDAGERTLFQGILALPASHRLVVTSGAAAPRIECYYELKPPHPGTSSDGERIEGLRELMMDAMRKHLISDVRVGSCLSGGLDSSAVVSLIGRLSQDRPDIAAALEGPLRTFTSCYDMREIDERDYALAVSSSVGASPNLVFPSAQDFWSDFERLAWHQDMPFGSFSFYAQWRVMRAAKAAGVKVLLDGQGGDEVFGGYAKFRYAYLASLLGRGRLPTLAREIAAMVRHGDRYVLDLRNGFRYLPPKVRRALNVDSALERVLRKDLQTFPAGEATPAARWWRNAAGLQRGRGGATAMQRIQLDDIESDTLPQLLRLEDRSSMAFSIEARVPLLDHRLVEFGLWLPDHLKVNHGWSKFAVRQAMKGLMPEEVRMRKSKLGFAAPDRVWLSRDLRPQVTEFFSGRLRCEKYVDPAALREWYASPRVDSSNTSAMLGIFRVLSLEMWMRRFSVTA
jgi:asparagine synthase (glutamine-hydrolysing)